MGAVDNFISRATLGLYKPKAKESRFLIEEDSDRLRPEAFNNYSPSNYRHVVSIHWDGEKNTGELGPILNYLPNLPALRLRSWQAFHENDIVLILMGKFQKWVIGRGLKVQPNPEREVLKQEGITLDENFTRAIQRRFMVYAESKLSDYSEQENLNRKTSEAFKNALISGDILVVLRVKDDWVKVQTYDASQVSNPLIMGANGKAPNGNIIREGVEMDDKGVHIAYHVRIPGTLEHQRIVAKNKNGNTVSYLVYGTKYRIGSSRGLPLFSAILETLKKQERYKEATVGSAEERQKIVYFIEHNKDSDGSSPLLRNIVSAYDVDGEGDNKLPTTDDGERVAREFAVSTNKQAFNLTQGATMKSLTSDNELSFKDFYNTLFTYASASMNMPAEVALSKYDSNYSASRGAIKDWEHTLEVARYFFASEFLMPIYTLWTELQVLKDKVEAPGYLDAILGKKTMALEAYRMARYIGPTVPSIDPKKEVDAKRALLGPLGEKIPLSTVAKVTEDLGEGDYLSNMEHYSTELAEAEKMGFTNPEPVENPNPEDEPPVED